MAQLIALSADGLVPAVEIEDHPDISVRGFMLDISRDWVPTRATLERYVELLALGRFNQFQLYTEHSFAHAGHDVVWADASPITCDDLRWLDGICAESGIELVVNRNCFGHFERWLRHDAYRGRAEAPDGAEVFPGVVLPASVLAPTPDNASFALSLVREQLGCVKSRRVNIGCDETFELGAGASADECAARGQGAVYVDHVKRLAGPLLEDGYEVQVWADVLRRHPELAADLPSGVIPIAWLYEAAQFAATKEDLPFGLAEILADAGIDVDVSGGFEANVAPLVDNGIEFWVAPGTGDWSSFVGRWDNALANQIDAAEVAVRHGARGYLVCSWGDNGHHHPPSVTWGPMLHGGGVAWGLEANRSIDLPSVLDRWAFEDESETLGRVLEKVGCLWTQTGRRSFNCSPLTAALFDHLIMLVTGEVDVDKVEAVIRVLDNAFLAVARATPRCRDAEQVKEEMQVALAMARLGAARLLGGAPREARGLDQESEKVPSDGLAGLDDEAILERYEKSWLGRARPGGLEDSASHLRKALSIA